MTGPRRLLLFGLTVILLVVMAQALIGILVIPRFAVDIEIPLRAADRWMMGQAPYLAESFQAPPGADLPFLYPPPMLPFLAILNLLPHEVVDVTGIVALLGGAVLACRRLAVPWLWVPLFVAWPPFAEGIVTGNVQIALFTAYVYLFFSPGGPVWRARSRDISDPENSGVMVGGLATLVGAIKVSQPHAWFYALSRRPRAAIGAATVAAIIATASVLFTGIGVWTDWLTQLRLASDPAWHAGGIALTRYLPNGLGLAIAIACLAIVPFVPWRVAGAWIGLLSVVGALSLHTFGLLFLLPAMLLIRREISLIAAILIATYTLEGTWAAILICAISFSLSSRWAILREPVTPVLA